MKTVEYNLLEFEIIKTHEILAYPRIQEGFEAFTESNITEYDYFMYY